VRSTSGTGNAIESPNRWPPETCFGIWSIVLAEYTLRVASDWVSGTRYMKPAMVWNVGLPK
jgi:hypothetical protein